MLPRQCGPLDFAGPQCELQPKARRACDPGPAVRGEPMMNIVREITGIGWRADAALRGGHAEARVLAVLSTSIYVDAGGEVLWVGARDATPHPRAIHASRTPDACHAGARVSVALPTDARPWRPDDAPSTAEAAAAAAAAAPRPAPRAAAPAAPRAPRACLPGLPLALPPPPPGAGAA